MSREPLRSGAMNPEPVPGDGDYYGASQAQAGRIADAILDEPAQGRDAPPGFDVTRHTAEGQARRAKTDPPTSTVNGPPRGYGDPRVA